MYTYSLSCSVHTLHSPLTIKHMEYLSDGPLPVDYVYDDMNDAHAHNLMHIVYMALEYINDGDHE